MRPRILDLFCGAGGAAMGYYRAGFDVVGVDIKPQPRYPFEFIQADALEVLTYEALPHDALDFDAIHASPPCQFGTSLRSLHPGKSYANLIAPVRDLLSRTGLPFVIENVEGAAEHLQSPLKLCGSAFGLHLRRHRYFECSGFDAMSPGCAHGWQSRRFISPDQRLRNQTAVVPIHGEGKMLTSVIGVYGSLNYAGELELRKQAMGIDWMTNAELTQAIPPAYTEHVGGYLMLETQRRARLTA
jgi:DNA (cytosine-5)-methyltransferase 1